jgi:lysophospholipase L1-like esterase
MKDIYLLAASLLTGVAIPASALSRLSIIHQENYAVLMNLNEDSQSKIDNKIKSDANISSPQLINHNLQIPVKSDFTLNSNLHPINHQPLSGSQLYYQRLAALKAGHSYKRIINHEQQLLWKSIKKSQLTYEDWKNLLAMEAKAMALGQGTNHLGILVGDSLSMWFPKEKLSTSKLWLNQGISGDTSQGILKRLSAFAETRPDVIYIMAGINDLRKGATDETILHNHRLIIHRLRQAHPKTQIVVQSILPTRLPTISNSRIRRINYQLALIAKQEGANYLNLYSWFTDFQGNLKEDLTTDGLHLSQPGYEVWRLVLQQTEFHETLSAI